MVSPAPHSPSAARRSCRVVRGPSSKRVVTASGDEAARLWDAQSGKELQRLTHEGGDPSSLAAAPTAAPSSPRAPTGRPDCGTPSATSCNASRR